MMKWRFITGSKPEVKPRVRPRMLDERQELVGADPLPDITPAGEVALPPKTRTATEVITVINGHTVVAPVARPSPGPPVPPVEVDKQSTPAEEVSSPTTRTRPATTEEPTSASETEDSTQPSTATTTSSPSVLDSPSTESIIDSTSPPLNEEHETGSRTKSRPDKTTSASKSRLPAATSEAGKKDTKDSNDKGSVTTWAAIAAGVIGGLLLIMAISAYYRRWRRKQREKQKATADDESFVTTKQVDHPESPIYGRGWSGAPAMPPMPAAYHVRSGRASLLPEPGSDHRLEDTAPWRQDAYSSEAPPMAPMAVPRRDSVAEPMTIQTSGNSRHFSRPVSEVILNGQNEQVGEQYYDYAANYAAPNLRHPSYSSSRYEAIEDGHRPVMDYRYQ